MGTDCGGGGGGGNWTGPAEHFLQWKFLFSHILTFYSDIWKTLL